MTFGDFRQRLADEFDLAADSLREETDFLEELAFDSLRMLQLAVFFEDLGVDMPDDMAWEIETIGDAYTYYAAQAGVGEPLRPPSAAVAASDRRQGPLSSAQLGVWLHSQLEPGATFYNNRIAVRLQGPLDPNLLQRSVNEIVHRHEPLRTIFPAVNGEPVQDVQPSLQLSVPTTSISVGPGEDPLDAALRVAAEQAARPFDLSCDPPIRLVLLHLGPDDHVLLVVLHAIISDGASIMIFLEELATLYAAYGRGEPSPLEELPLQPLDLVRREREEERTLTAGIEYWVGQLANAPPLLALAADRARRSSPSHTGAVYQRQLSSELTADLHAFCRRQGVTLYMAVLAAFQALLHRYTGQRDILVGSPITHRTRPEVRGMIGYLVNTLVLRTSFTGDETFRGLLGRVRDTAIAAYRHSYVPFDRVIQALRPPRSPSHHPVYQVILALQDTPSGPLDESRVRIPGLTLTFPPSLDIGTSLVDVTLSVYQVGEQIGLSFEYSTDLFDEAAMARMADHFTTLIDAAVREPTTAVSVLPLISAAEQPIAVEAVRQDAPAETARTSEPSAALLAVLDAFREHARRTPSATAAISGTQRRTYTELYREAGRLAHELASHSEVRRTSTPSDPLARLITLLATLQATPDRPDAVLGDPGGAATFSASLAWLAGEESPLRSARALVAAGPVPEEWWILASLLQLSRGGIVIYGEAASSTDGVAGGDALIGTSGTALSALLPPPSEPPRTIVLVGEPPLVRPWRLSGAGRVAELYGSAAGSPCTAFCWLDEAPDGARPIGHAIAGQRLYVLNKRLQPAPPGVPGRLYVGGAATDAVALLPPSGLPLHPDPFVADGVMLATDDLARCRADGTFELLGSVSQPSEIDGVPVMPCQVEAALAEHPGVTEAVVVQRSNAGAKAALVAAVVPRPGVELASAELHDHLRRRVARHLVPEELRIERLLPRTDRGRIDRAAVSGAVPGGVVSGTRSDEVAASAHQGSARTDPHQDLGEAPWSTSF